MYQVLLSKKFDLDMKTNQTPVTKCHGRRFTTNLYPPYVILSWADILCAITSGRYGLTWGVRDSNPTLVSPLPQVLVHEPVGFTIQVLELGVHVHTIVSVVPIA